MERDRSLGRRAPLLWILLPLLAGYSVARALPAGAGGLWWLGAALAGWVLAASGVGRAGRAAAWRWGAGLALAGLAGGVTNFQLHEHRLEDWDRRPPREAELVLRVGYVFPAAAGKATVAGFGRIVEAPPLLGETVGQRVYFSLRPTESGPELMPSARVRASGVLEVVPRRPTETGFVQMLADAGAGFRFTRGRVVAEVIPASGFQRFCTAARHRFDRILSSGLERQPALRAMYVAMLLGRKAELSAEQRELFMESGTMHLVVVSGLHVAVIWGALSALLAVLRVPRLVATLLGLVLLFGYVEITGAAPAAVRAWMMIAFVLAGGALRWPHSALAGITASALVVALLDPWVYFGASFRMSYGVVAALLLYGTVLDERWQRRWRPWVARPEADWRWWQHAVRGGGRMFISGLAVSVSAGLVSAITSVSIFGILTPGALAMNVLLVPVALLAVTAGFAALLAGLAGLGPLVVLFNHAGIAVLWVVAHGMEAARLPLMFWSAQFRAPWCGPAALAVLLGVMLWGYAQGWRRSIGGLWLPVALVLVVLLCGVRAPEGAPARPGLAGGLTGLPAARWVNPARVSLAGSPAAWRETPVRERLAGLPVPAEASIAMRP